MALRNHDSDLPVRVRSDVGPVTGAAIVVGVVEDDGVVTSSSVSLCLVAADARNGEAASERDYLDRYAGSRTRMGSEVPRALRGAQRGPPQRWEVICLRLVEPVEGLSGVRRSAERHLRLVEGWASTPDRSTQGPVGSQLLQRKVRRLRQFAGPDCAGQLCGSVRQRARPTGSRG